MEGELGSGARIAIALIVIGVIISVIFVILGFTRGTTNQGITTVQNSMDSMSLAQFDDYDQKILSGTQVISAIKLFEGRPVASVVRTRASMGITPAIPLGNGKGYNYGAVLVGSDATHLTVDMNDTTTIKPAGQSWYTMNLLTNAAGSMVPPNMNYLPLTASATATFVRPTAKFLAEMIKDNTGTIVGICYSQQ